MLDLRENAAEGNITRAVLSFNSSSQRIKGLPLLPSFGTYRAPKKE